MKNDQGFITDIPGEAAPSHRERLGPAFAAGTHIFFYLAEFDDGAPSLWHGAAVVSGKDGLFCRSCPSSGINHMLSEFTSQFGMPDSVHIYFSRTAAKAAHPGFYG